MPNLAALCRHAKPDPLAPGQIFAQSAHYQSWFTLLWEISADESAFYPVYEAITKEAGIFRPWSEYDHAWQYTQVLHEDLERAKQEFVLVLNHTF